MSFSNEHDTCPDFICVQAVVYKKIATLKIAIGDLEQGR